MWRIFFCLFVFVPPSFTLSKDGITNLGDPFEVAAALPTLRYAPQYQQHQYQYQQAACQNCGCGESFASRVVGGTGASPNKFPWLARLIYHKNFACAASLINDRYVVSAAHCVKGFMWFMFRVTFGEHDRCTRTEQPVTRSVVKIVAHNFTIQVLSNDISLLQLSSPVTFTHMIRPVCLPRRPVTDYTGSKSIVSGWGATKEGGKWSCIPQFAELPVLSLQSCRATKYNATKIKDVMLCAGYPETAHKDGCTGDSGGPLVRENESRSYELIGIVSWGYGCARLGYPGVYTRVTEYLDWIRDNTGGACYCKY